MKRLRGCILPVALLFAAGSGLLVAEGKPEDPTRSQEGYMWYWKHEEEDEGQDLLPPLTNPPTAAEIFALVEEFPALAPPFEELSDDEVDSVISISSGPDYSSTPGSPWENSEGAEQHGPGDDDGDVEAGSVTGLESPRQEDEEAQSDSTGHG